MTKTENTALQMIAEAARCPGYERKGLCASDERYALHCPALDQRRRSAQRHGQAPDANL